MNDALNAGPSQGRQVYRGTPGDRLDDRQFSYVDLQPNGANAPFPVRLQGDWVYSDPTNPGIAVLDYTAPSALSGDVYQPNTITVRPGDAVQFPVRDLAVGVSIVTGRVRLIYGNGPCPFASNYSGHSSAYGGIQAGTTFPLQMAIPPFGILDSVSVRATRITAAAETSRLRARLQFVNSVTLATTHAIWPDQQQVDDVAVAGVGQSSNFALWRDLPIPQGTAGGVPVLFDRVQVDFIDLGNAATNPITRTGANDGFLLR